jgi:transposase
MLRDRNKTTVIKYLRSLPDAHIILNVAMDMWKPYKDSVQSVLPHATIVIDKFHVVRMANDALEKCQKQIRANMSIKQRRDLMNDRFIMLKRNHNHFSNNDSNAMLLPFLMLGKKPVTDLKVFLILRFNKKIKLLQK